MKFNDFIRQERTRQKISKISLSRMIGSSEGFVSYFETSSYGNTSILRGDSLCCALGVSYKLGLDEGPGGTPTEIPFMEILKEEFKKYGNYNKFSQAVGFPSGTIYHAMNRLNGQENDIRLFTVRDLCKAFGITYVLGSGANTFLFKKVFSSMGRQQNIRYKMQGYRNKYNTVDEWLSGN